MASTELAEVQKGKATLFGITNDGDDITIDALATFILKSARLTQEFDLVDEKDATGYDANAVATNGRLRCEINVTLSGATRAAAAATGVALTPLAPVVLDNFKMTVLNGTWQYTGNQTIDLSAGANATMTIPLRKYTNSTQNTSMTTAVSG